LELRDETYHQLEEALETVRVKPTAQATFIKSLESLQRIVSEARLKATAQMQNDLQTQRRAAADLVADIRRNINQFVNDTEQALQEVQRRVLLMSQEHIDTVKLLARGLKKAHEDSQAFINAVKTLDDLKNTLAENWGIYFTYNCQV
jgi:hypothetical protein